MCSCSDSLVVGLWDMCFAPSRAKFADIEGSLKTGDLLIGECVRPMFPQNSQRGEY